MNGFKPAFCSSVSLTAFLFVRESSKPATERKQAKKGKRMEWTEVGKSSATGKPKKEKKKIHHTDHKHKTPKTKNKKEVHKTPPAKPQNSQKHQPETFLQGRKIMCMVTISKYISSLGFILSKLSLTWGSLMVKGREGGTPHTPKQHATLPYDSCR